MKKKSILLFLVIITCFAKAQNHINYYEYWFDNNYSSKISSSMIPVVEFDMRNTPVSTTSISNGLHTFNIRFRDDSLRYSAVVSEYFLKLFNRNLTTNLISALRYWFDKSDTAFKQIKVSTSYNPYQIITQVNASNLSVGAHQIHLQVLDAFGQWSSVITDTFVKYGRPKIDKISPDSGGNIGNVTATITGTGFYTGASVMLVKTSTNDTIKGTDSLTVFIQGQRLQTNFNLRNAKLGNYDLVVVIPNDTTMRLTNAFKVTSGIKAQVWSSLSGFDAIRVNQWQNYTITVGNNGNVDATAVPLWISVPQNAQVEFNFPVTNPYGNAFNYDTIQNSFNTDSVWQVPSHSTMYSFLISKIPPGQTKQYSFKIKVASTGGFQIQSWVNKPLYASPLDASTSKCLHTLCGQVYGQLVDKIPLASCLYSAQDAIVTIWKDSPWGDLLFGNGTSDPNFGSEEYILNYSKTLVSMTLSCNPFPISKTLTKAVEIAQHISDFSDDYQDCAGTFSTTYQVIRNNINIVSSLDPNEKLGPKGAGSSNYYNDKNTYNYSIHFENADSATASAQTVLIIDTLDQSVFDLKTFRFGFVSIGDTIIQTNQNGKDFQTLLNLSSTQNVIVQITAHLNDTTGRVTWLFQSLSTESLTPVTNPFLGFLPPNDTLQNGEGAVFYSVNLKPNLALNTKVKNKAYIFFDNNPPMTTQNWTNTIDNIKPNSHVLPLAVRQKDTAFIVNWSGTDTSSGVSNFSIYVSTNGIIYRPWIINANYTKAIFNGKLDSTYSFYSIALDSAGNKEDTPLVADATTKIIALGINNPLKESKIRIFPNPTEGVFTIDFDSPNENKIIEVFNVSGKMVKQISTSDIKVELDLQSFTKGIYFLRITTEQNIINSKLVLE